MAGKKGMKQARPRNQEEKDIYALARIEQYIDSHVFKCDKCKSDMNLKDMAGPVATLLAKRYDKLRASKTESVITHKTSFIDALTKIQQQDHTVSKPKPIGADPNPDQASIH